MIRVINSPARFFQWWRDVDEREEEGFFGTFAPAWRASESPMAMACLRLFTVLPELPLFNVPALRSCMAFATLSLAVLPY